VPETVSQLRRPELRFAGLGIPEESRDGFLAAAVAGFAALSVFALVGIQREL
jgi:hypothetical protein